MFNLIPWSNKSKDIRVREDERHPLTDFRSEFNTLLDRFFGQWPQSLSNGELPMGWGLDAEDRENEFVVRADVPGFEPNEIDVSISGNCLTIHAETKQEKNGNGGYHRVQRSFHRAVTVPTGVDRDKVEAKYHNGVLEVQVPKTEQSRAKRIAVRS